MPCMNEGADQHYREQERLRRLKGFRLEVGLPAKKSADEHEDARALCAWAKAHPSEIASKSLEFQIWWRDHQVADKARERAEAAQAVATENRPAIDYLERLIRQLRAGEVRALRYESHRDKIERPHDGQIRAFEVLPTYTLTLYLEQRQ